jgi:hypothetical protein
MVRRRHWHWNHLLLHMMVHKRADRRSRWDSGSGSPWRNGNSGRWRDLSTRGTRRRTTSLGELDDASRQIVSGHFDGIFRCAKSGVSKMRSRLG